MNEKEIYEGDILEWINQTDEPDDKNYGLVEFVDGSFVANLEYLDNLDLESFVIVGNLYENPELLRDIK
jgi:hypothetical protein